MKNKILIIFISVFVSIFMVDAYVIAQQGSGAGADNQNQQQTQTINQGEDSEIQVQNQEQVQNEEGVGNQVQNQEQGQEQVQQPQSQGQANAEQHRSTVANFVQNLQEVADREAGIGEQVRTIAQQQNQSATTTIQAMEKVQTRNRVKTFFLGTDYNNLGNLRSEMVHTRNRLEQLERLVENVQNEGDRIELQNQIQTLEQEQIRIENFVKAEERRFSLFGWLVKLLTGYRTLS